MFEFEPAVYEIVLRDNRLALEPSMEDARRDWVGELHRCCGEVCALRRLETTRYDGALVGGAQAGGGEEKGGAEGGGEDGGNTFAHLLGTLPPGLLRKAYAAVAKTLARVQKFVGTWLQYGALWTMDAAQVWAALGGDLPRWRRLVRDVKNARAALFDASGRRRSFGALTVDFGGVQARRKRYRRPLSPERTL